MERKQMMRIMICDDQPDRTGEVENAIRASGVAEHLDISIHQLTGDQLTQALRAVFERAEECFRSPEEFDAEEGLEFDDYDLLLFDNNLAHLKIGGARLTAESMVGYVRAFSKCPYIVSLNKNPDVDFDLRFLVGDYETRADLALNTNHLSNLALWTGSIEDAAGGFLPWYWPKLRSAPERRLRQVEFVADHLESKVLAALDLPEDSDTLSYLSLHGRGSLVPSELAGEWCFIDVFGGRDRSLVAETQEDRTRLVKEHSDLASVRQVVARVVAADVDLWFRRDLISPQEMLVDVAHLLPRMPFLLGEKATEIEHWNSAAWATEEPYGIDRSLFQEYLAGSVYKHDCWTGRPMLNWPMLKSDEKLDELFFELISDAAADLVFCEDQSVFRDRTPELEKGQFSAEFEGSWSRRYVAGLENHQYRPLSRFAI